MSNDNTRGNGALEQMMREGAFDNHIEEQIAKKEQKEDLLQLLEEATLPKVKEDIRKLLQDLEGVIIV